jgi:hypothetical protein
MASDRIFMGNLAVRHFMLIFAAKFAALFAMKCRMT